MRMQFRSFSVSLLLSASMMVGLGAQASAQDNPSLWSDPASWPDGKVPSEGDAVMIERNREIVLDVDPPSLRSLTIDGKLSFSDDLDIDLETEWIYLRRGEMHIGSEANPHTRDVTITLTDNFPGEDINTMGDRGILAMGGTLTMHGDTQHTWSKLAKSAEAGSTQIELLNASGWQKGDEIVLASTDFNPRQAEKRVIAAIDGNVITLDSALEYMHFGEITFGVDERGEVGLLSRNIRVQSSEDSTSNYFGGHIMAMAGSKMYVSGVELYRMGQHMNLARYPIHWHIIGEGAGQYIQNSSIHDSYSRCVTVHGTDNARVENNVTFNTVGHCFFLEDGIETGNQFISNLGIQTKCHPTLPCDPSNLAPGRPPSNGQSAEHILLPSDNTASTFWITNPDNIYRDNVAAGSDEIGFWFALPVHPTGAHEGTEISANTWPRRTRVREFSGNTAHSNFDGFMFDRGPKPDNTFGVGGSNYHIAYSDPTDTDSEKLVSLFENYTGYKNRNGAIWGRGELHMYKNAKLADNAIGFTHAASAVGQTAYTSKVIDSLFVGETANIGNPTTSDEVAYGRSLPGEVADFPIRGYEYYDMRHDVEDTTFVNFEPNALRDAGAISYLMYTSFGMSSENAIEGATFINSKRVSFPATVSKWASDFGRGNAWRGAAIHDRDGSVGGIPDSYIVLDNGIASDEDACEIKPEWGAAVCQGDFGHFGLGGNMGFGNGPISDPIMLSRNGRRWEYTGQTTIRSGAEVRVETGKETLSLSVREMDDGSSVIFELPGFGTAAEGVEQNNLEALRGASDTAYFKDGDTLWVKLVVDNTAGQSISIGRVGFGVSTVGPGPGGAFDAGARVEVSR